MNYDINNYTKASKVISSQVAEIELRYKRTIPASQLQQVTSSQHAYEALVGFFEENITFVEEFKVLLLNRNNKAIGVANMTKGITGETLVEVKHIIAAAIKGNACAIIVAHNHPSGSFTPSQKDDDLVKKIQTACTYMDIRFLDSLILTDEGYFSYTDMGRM
jgi:DNA repair protein RadC